MGIEYLLLLQNFRNSIGGVLNPFMEAVSFFIVSIWFYLLIAAIYWCFNKSVGSHIMMSLSSGYVLNQVVKNTFCVYRPWVRDPRIVPVGNSIETSTGYSFPSGHTQMATAIFGGIALWQKKRKWVAILSIAFIFLVMFSRNYLGVHTPQDVIVGFLLCAFIVYINKKIIKWSDNGRNRDLIVFFVGILLCIAFLAYCQLKSYPIDYKPDGSTLVDPVKMIIDCYAAAGCFFGFLIGWICERHFIKFQMPKNVIWAVLRFLIGAATFYPIFNYTYSPLTSMFGSQWGNVCYFSILFFWIMAGFPFCFNTAETLFNRKRTLKQT